LEFVQNNLLWVSVAVVSGAMLLWSFIAERGGSAVSPMQATLMINREDAVLIDVREAAEFAQGRIANSLHIPLAQLEKRLAELEKYKERAIILNCASGSRSGSACSLMRKHGFNKVFSLSGGIASWEQAGLPTTRK
jgi:rhodanese-related sulfurtransferase